MVKKEELVFAEEQLKGMVENSIKQLTELKTQLDDGSVSESVVADTVESISFTSDALEIYRQETEEMYYAEENEQNDDTSMEQY